MKFNKLKYSDGNTRIRAKFAFHPVRIDDQTVIWLEKYYEQCRYTRGIRGRYFWLRLRVWQEK